MAELTRFVRAAPRVIPALVAGIQREAGVGSRVWLDAGDEPRHDKGGWAWRN
jgi:hypothetical protein